MLVEDRIRAYVAALEAVLFDSGEAYELLKDAESELRRLRGALTAWMNYAECVCDGMPAVRLDKEFEKAIAASALSPDGQGREGGDE